MGYEGFAAKTYFENFNLMLKNEDFVFQGRNKRPPKDPINTMLSYGYTLLQKDIAVILMRIGFDVYAGFLHGQSAGRYNLSLDIMEVFRALIVDSIVITLINGKKITKNDFYISQTGCTFKDSGKRIFLQYYEKRLETLITHSIFDYKISYRRLLDVELRLFAKYLIGEIKEYNFFMTR